MVARALQTLAQPCSSLLKIPIIPEILFKYSDLIVFNKPANVQIDGEHAGSLSMRQYIERNESFKHYFEDSQEELSLKQRKQTVAKRRVFFPHQLDYPTSGIICVTFTKNMARTIATCFNDRIVEKFYLAIVNGHFDSSSVPPLSSLSLSPPPSPPPSPPLSPPLSPSISSSSSTVSTESGIFTIWTPAVVDDPSDPTGFKCCIGSRGDSYNGLDSITQVRVLSQGYINGQPASKLFMKLVTGKRHQLRVHMKHIGHPIVGDYTYGKDDAKQFSRMYLHAWRIRIPLDEKRRKIKNGEYNKMLSLETKDPFIGVLENETEWHSAPEFPINLPEEDIK